MYYNYLINLEGLPFMQCDNIFIYYSVTRSRYFNPLLLHGLVFCKYRANQSWQESIRVRFGYMVRIGPLGYMM